ncbi:MAG: PIG-L deacetylase family protein [Pseudomonadota bacterium]
MSVLVVVAHPDDEVLGCGGAIALWRTSGVPVTVRFLSGGADARSKHPGNDALKEDAGRALQSLGGCKMLFGAFPNIKFNAVPHLDLVQYIESAIVESGATDIVTHHPSDLNNDHRHTSLACQAAARLSLRRDDAPRLRSLSFMEVLSATDWSFGGSAEPFVANTYLDVSTVIDKKIDALACYRDVMRPNPHSRSAETIRALATLRGSESGYAFAEAFQCVYRDLSAAED